MKFKPKEFDFGLSSKSRWVDFSQIGGQLLSNPLHLNRKGGLKKFCFTFLVDFARFRSSNIISGSEQVSVHWRGYAGLQ
ncbi:MAG: hypothetical protein EBZ49_17775 [Proteobacteria bacterium]|nr:hypothetical protein [Pseudomonadota bacterium]